MKRKFILIIIILIIVLAVGLILIRRIKEEKNQVCFKNNCFNVELALTEKEKEKGLMFRKSLGQNWGMFFVFDKEEKYSFYMKNTLIPLDIIWINANNEVVFISENTMPCEKDFCPSIEPVREAKYVLEINGGLVEKIGLKIGDKLEFK
jgi:hypothetical protein